MKQVFFKLGVFLIVLSASIFLLPTQSVRAIASECQDPSKYDVVFDINPKSVGINSSFTVSARFRWKDSSQTCLDTPLVFDLSAEWIKPPWRARDIKEFPFSHQKLVVNQWENLEEKIPVQSLYSNFSEAAPGQMVKVKLLIEGTIGNNLYSAPTSTVPEVQLIIVGDDASEKSCAYADAKGKNFCIPNTKAYADKGDCAHAPVAAPDTAMPLDNGCVKYSCYTVSTTQCGLSASGANAPTAPDGDINVKGLDFGFKINPPNSWTNISDMLASLANFVFQLGTMLAVILIVYNGFLYMTSGGDVSKTKKARMGIFYSVLGLGVLIIGKGFVSLIMSLIDALGKSGGG